MSWRLAYHHVFFQDLSILSLCDALLLFAALRALRTQQLRIAAALSSSLYYALVPIFPLLLFISRYTIYNFSALARGFCDDFQHLPNIIVRQWSTLLREYFQDHLFKQARCHKPCPPVRELSLLCPISLRMLASWLSPSPALGHVRPFWATRPQVCESGRT